LDPIPPVDLLAGNFEMMKDTCVSSQFSVVQVALKNNQLAFLEIIMETGIGRWQTPVAAALGPETIRPEHKLTFGMESTPFLE
jgi:hypothetical protein